MDCACSWGMAWAVFLHGFDVPDDRRLGRDSSYGSAGTGLDWSAHISSGDREA